ncbi:hypothetical protein ACI7RC_03385 [Brevibacillus sp. B_LB10_24]|uniref:hypothetical protein n=1 Tax=Brevibacillus sp. B_LB10_24 TaxID=3380645 RepID=UPI0038BC4F00
MRYFLLLLILLLMGCSTGYSQESVVREEVAAAENIRATWLWNTPMIASEKDQIISFVKENGINLIYLQVNRRLVTKEQYRAFLKSAHEAGIEVHALDGAPDWALGKNQDRLTALVTWVKDYNQSVAEDERFRGVHVDIEPYLLPEWKQDKSAVIRQWIDNVQVFVQQAKSDPELETGADTPFWLDTLQVSDDPGAETVSRWMARTFDHVTLMAYRNHAEGPNGILQITQNKLAEADELGRRIVIGVNIRESTEGDFVTFYKEGAEEMEQQIAIVDERLSGRPSYAGISIHDYQNWKNSVEKAR